MGNGEPAVGLLSTEDSLFVTDMSSTGGILGPADAGRGVIHRVTAVPGPAVEAGASFLVDGASVKSGPPARVALFATRAEPGFAYQLVSGRDGGNPQDPCSADLAPISGAVKFATTTGVLGITAGVLDRPPGPWQICFRSTGPGPRAVTAAVTYTVT